MLKGILPHRPDFIYRKALNLRQELVINAIDQPKSKSKREGGFSRCGQCAACKNTGGLKPPVRSFSSAVTKQTFKCKFEATCGTQGVVYLLQCPCNLQYVGKTKTAFKIRVGEHIRNIKNGIITHSVSDHFSKFHNKDPTKPWYSIIEVVRVNWRGGNPERLLSQREMRWTHTLSTFAPLGLNIEMDLNCFLENY